ncbi:hypothetical protein DFH06DRAFT_1130117 [Mycena polygramma]|nr:hypothetical protein DFH06DRAFT_1130117 [Mycena polygramma]
MWQSPFRDYRMQSLAYRPGLGSKDSFCSLFGNCHGHGADICNTLLESGLFDHFLPSSRQGWHFRVSTHCVECDPHAKGLREISMVVSESSNWLGGGWSTPTKDIPPGHKFLWSHPFESGPSHPWTPDLNKFFFVLLKVPKTYFRVSAHCVEWDHHTKGLVIPGGVEISLSVVRGAFKNPASQQDSNTPRIMKDELLNSESIKVTQQTPHLHFRMPEVLSSCPVSDRPPRRLSSAHSMVPSSDTIGVSLATRWTERGGYWLGGGRPHLNTFREYGEIE